MKPGFLEFHGFVINPMGIFAGILIALICLVFYFGQKGDDKFNIFDAFMSDGKTSIVALTFFGTWATSTWVVLDREMKGTLDSGLYNMYLMMWVAPLLTRVGLKAAGGMFPGGKKEGE